MEEKAVYEVSVLTLDLINSEKELFGQKWMQIDKLLTASKLSQLCNSNPGTTFEVKTLDASEA